MGKASMKGWKALSRQVLRNMQMCSTLLELVLHLECGHSFLVYLCANLLRNLFCFAGSFSKQLERLYAQEAAVAAENPSPSDCFVCVLDRGLIWLCQNKHGNISVDMSGTY
jgi:hypothetical protein